MKKLSILILKVFFISTILILNSCNNSDLKKQDDKELSEDEIKFAGKWKLVQEKSDGSSDIELNIEKAGYFELNTILNDPKFAEAGIDKIQPISKGQWKVDSNKLLLTKNIGQNSPKTDEFKIKSISDNKMELISKKKKLITYIK
ncbi:MAG: hypothetical protein LW701_06455 [Fluviicola sp.]|jgi:hypothetical protein|nr:hypothetical protein [Fluviicola sp.]